MKFADFRQNVYYTMDWLLMNNPKGAIGLSDAWMRGMYVELRLRNKEEYFKENKTVNIEELENRFRRPIYIKKRT